MKKIFALTLGLFMLCACTPKTYISKSYDFGGIKRIGILAFNSPTSTFSGAENLFSKYLLKYGYTVVERAQIEEVLAEQNLSVDSYLSPEVTRKIGKVLGVDVLLMGEVTSYLPERKTLTYNVTRTNTSEPVFNQQVTKDPEGKVHVKSTYAGQMDTHRKDIYPTEYTIYAQVGVVAKMVDVNTAEIIWVGDDTCQGVSGLDALDSSAKGLIKSFDKAVRRAKQADAKR
jgi:curli biogenesis system outer membrane secretion channel CsgG